MAELTEDIHEVAQAEVVSTDFNVGSYKVIYAFSYPDSPAHQGMLKVGDATVYSDKQWWDIPQDEIEKAARARIDRYTKTLGATYKLELAEVAVFRNSKKQGAAESFRDYKVHDVLMANGHKKQRLAGHASEWFKVSLDEVRAAISAVKTGRTYVSPVPVAIVLRPEQERAVNQTLKAFAGATLEVPKRVLWNAKMRFGKTLTTYGLLKKLETDFAAAQSKGEEAETPFKRVLILTHRPNDVAVAWKKDFDAIGLSDFGWQFASKKHGLAWETLDLSGSYIYFASVQDLRGSFTKKTDEVVKNHELFATEFDLIVSDEAHNGLTTDLAKKMFRNLKASRTLDLSGTPFNISSAEDSEDAELARRFTYDHIYVWSYPDERKALENWEREYGHTDMTNPYGELPEIRFVTYDVSAAVPVLADANGQFGISFTDLFAVETDENGAYPSNPDDYRFSNESQVLALLQKIRGDGAYSHEPKLFPYSGSYQENFEHTLWMLPSAMACTALENLLKQTRSGFAGFKVVNATGRGKSTWDEASVESSVKAAIRDSDHTITLSYQMLTTGVSIPEWTGVFMFTNTSNPMSYMQVAFRCTTSGVLKNGKQKEAGYVFDFNPNRCLEMIVEVAKYNAEKAEKGAHEEQRAFDKAAVRDYLRYISLISLKEGKFVKPDDYAILEQLNNAYVGEILESGFESPRLWNMRELRHFDISKKALFDSLATVLGGMGSEGKTLPKTQISTTPKEILDEIEDIAAKPKRQRTPEEQKKLEENKKALAEARKNRQNGIAVLTGIAVRMPMLVFASPAEMRFTPENFHEQIDEESWREFMPKNLKRLRPEGVPTLEEDPERLGPDNQTLYWEDVQRFFDADIFEQSCERVRQLTREADEKPILERAVSIAYLFSTFKRPDKETVLTPFRVAQLQYMKTLGGLCLIDLEASTASETLILTKNRVTGELESHGLKKTMALLSEETHELAPVWHTSDVDPVENDGKDFWEDKDVSIYDINSKTALYPLTAAISSWYALRPHFHRRLEEQGEILEETQADRDLWRRVVENVIYVNSRVAYSSKLARRVLAGYDESIKVNTSTVDVIALKKAAEAWNRKEDGKGVKHRDSDVWKKIDDVYDFVGSVLRLANVGFIQNKAPMLYRALMMNPAWLQLTTTLGKIDSGEWTMKAMSELRKLVEKHHDEIPKFEAVVGNPPYQLQINNGAPAVYHLFSQFSFRISRNASLIHPSRWMNGGWGEKLDEFRTEQFMSKHYAKFFSYTDSEKFFKDIGIAGGLCFYLWTEHENGSLQVVHDGEETTVSTLGDLNGVKNSSYLAISSKVEAKLSMQLANWVSSPSSKLEKTGDWVLASEKTELKDDFVWFYYAKPGKGVQKIKIPLHYIDKPIDFFKTGVGGTAHSISSSTHARQDRIFVEGKQAVLGGSFQTLGFSTEEESINCLRYLKTDFANFLHAIITPTQQSVRRNYRLIPLLDFTTGEILDKPGTFLNFTPPENATNEELQNFLDDQLAEIYGLTKEERELMRKDLKPWKDKWDVEADR